MKDYTFFIQLLHIRITVASNNKFNARCTVRRMLDLTEQDEITCLGINL